MIESSIVYNLIGRWASWRDVSAVSHLLQRVSQAHPEVLGLNHSDEELKKSVENQELFIGDRGRGVCAAIVFQRSPDVWEVKALATQVESMGKNVMSSLLRQWLNLVPKGMEVWLETQDSNQKALKLYLSQGFEPVGERPSYYSDGSNAVLLTWRSI